MRSAFHTKRRGVAREVWHPEGGSGYSKGSATGMRGLDDCKRGGYGSEQAGKQKGPVLACAGCQTEGPSAILSLGTITFNFTLKTRPPDASGREKKEEKERVREDQPRSAASAIAHRWGAAPAGAAVVLCTCRYCSQLSPARSLAPPQRWLPLKSSGTASSCLGQAASSVGARGGGGSPAPLSPSLAVDLACC